MWSGSGILCIVLMLVYAQTGIVAGDVADGTPGSLVSLRRNALVRIGGTVRTDYTYRSMHSTPGARGGAVKEGDLSVRGATLRIDATLHPHVRAFFSLDVSGESDPGYEDDILAEAMLVMNAVGGTGLELFAGKGRAPYGQDITLGLIQSYSHAANRVDSPEGRVFIIDPPTDARENGEPGGKSLAPMRPGQWDKVFQAGAAYQWDALWRVELAAFQPDSAVYAARLHHDARQRNGSDLGFTARAWLRPTEDLTLQASAMAAHSSRMADRNARVDVRPDAVMRSNAYAFSLGFDWRREPWRVFGEYQRGVDWNFTDGYTVDTWQFGLARELADAWRVGIMGEHMKIADSAGLKRVDTYYELCFTIRYMFENGAYITGEYGYEWFRRKQGGAVEQKRSGMLVGVRVGLDF